MTKWKGLEIDEIEALVKEEHDEALEKQAEGWAALRELYDNQLTTMKEAHTNLAEAWTSPGGELYLGKFQKVIDALEKGKTVADSRATGIMDVAGKIGSTQVAVELIRKELDAEHERQFTQFESDMAAYRDYKENPVVGVMDSGWGWLSPAAKVTHELTEPDEPTQPKRSEIADQGSPSFNDRVNTAMTALAEEMTRVRTDSEMWEKPVYTGPKDGPAPPPNWGVIMPSMPGGMPGGAPPGMPATPSMPAMPNVPAPPNVPAAPNAPNMPTAPTTQTPNMPNIPVAPGMPGMPGAPRAPGAPPAVRAPGMPTGMSKQPRVANPMSNSRPVAPRTGAPGVPGAPTAPGKPGVPGKMAPPMSGMGPKGSQKGVNPGGPGRPGTPMGSSGIPGKPGMSGKMAPPPGGVPPKSAKQSPERKPGQPMHPANSGQPGKPGAAKGGKGGKPLAGKPSAAGGGGKPGGGQFQAPPHIGRPTGGNRSKQQQSGYGKFGPPEGTSLGGAPRVTRPGGSRPVLNNRAATPTQSPGAQNLGVPASQRPPSKAPRKETDSRGVIKPAKPEPKPTAPQRPADYYEKKATRLREHPKTAEYMDNLFKMVGLRSPVIQPAAPPKAHSAGPVIGT